MTKQLTQIDQLKAVMNLDTVKEQFKNALRDNAQLFQASIIELVTSDKNLQKCEPKSIIAGALTLATLKLPLNKSLGFAYLVPYSGSVQPQIGYKGLIQLAQRTGLYKCINAGAVYDGELKSIDKLSGEIDLTGEKVSDDIIGYFAYFSTNYGFKKSLYWTKDEVEKHAKRFSKTFKFGPWKTDFDAMACKTVLKSLISHYGPMTIDIGDSIAKIEEPDQAGFDIELGTDQEQKEWAQIADDLRKTEEPVKSLDEVLNNSEIDLSDDDLSEAY